MMPNMDMTRQMQDMMLKMQADPSGRNFNQNTLNQMMQTVMMQNAMLQQQCAMLTQQNDKTVKKDKKLKKEKKHSSSGHDPSRMHGSGISNDPNSLRSAGTNYSTSGMYTNDADSSSDSDSVVCANCSDDDSSDDEGFSRDFFNLEFKTFWCPNMDTPHNWNFCKYAHSYRDARRDPRIGYGPKPCPNWLKNVDHSHNLPYEQMCPRGVACPYSHGVKEQLYHPHFFRTGVCKEYKQRGCCSQEKWCVFWHTKEEKKKRRRDDWDYEKLLDMKAIEKYLPKEFLNPPPMVQSSKPEKSHSQVKKSSIMSYNPHASPASSLRESHSQNTNHNSPMMQHFLQNRQSESAGPNRTEENFHHHPMIQKPTGTSVQTALAQARAETRGSSYGSSANNANSAGSAAAPTGASATDDNKSSVNIENKAEAISGVKEPEAAPATANLDSPAKPASEPEKAGGGESATKKEEPAPRNLDVLKSPTSAK